MVLNRTTLVFLKISEHCCHCNSRKRSNNQEICSKSLENATASLVYARTNTLTAVSHDISSDFTVFPSAMPLQQAF